MNYNIFSSTAPAMPSPAKGTEFVKLLLSQASKDMQEPLVPMTIPALAAHLSGVEFMYSDNIYYELCGQMGHLIGPSGIGKGQFPRLIKAIQRSFRAHDETEYKRLEDWQRQKQTIYTADCVSHTSYLQVEEPTLFLCDFSVAKPSFYRH